MMRHYCVDEAMLQQMMEHIFEYFHCYFCFCFSFFTLLVIHSHGERTKKLHNKSISIKHIHAIVGSMRQRFYFYFLFFRMKKALVSSGFAMQVLQSGTTLIASHFLCISFDSIESLLTLNDCSLLGNAKRNSLYSSKELAHGIS